MFEYVPPMHKVMAPRRMAGEAAVSWYGQSPAALTAYPNPIFLPFTLVFVAESTALKQVEEWKRRSNGIPTIIAEKGGDIAFSELSFETLRSRFIDICDLIERNGEFANLPVIRNAIEEWESPKQTDLPFEVGGHAVVAPNIATLEVFGYSDPTSGPLIQEPSESIYIDPIYQTSLRVLEEREKISGFEAEHLFARTPAVNLYCPSTYDLDMYRSMGNVFGIERGRLHAAINILSRQDGYRFELTSPQQLKALMDIPEGEAENPPQPNLIMQLRQQELWLGTEAVACLSASEVGAVVRLPNRLNRTSGVVRQFAQHARSENPKPSKGQKLFARVQKALARSFPEKFQPLLDETDDPVRIIADAHLEWLDMDGFPLCLVRETCRIPTTPGNLFIDQVAFQPKIRLSPESLTKILVISGLDEEDVIAKQFTTAFKVFGEQWGDRVELVIKRVSSRQELIDALNEFDGHILFFDGHGSHKDDGAGVIWLQDESVNVWDLKGDIDRLPPIVILSACDTHAADRNHATVANGFLSIGALSVLGTVFPLHASHAAVFAARLIYRISEYIPAAIEMYGRSLTWLEVVAGMLRRQAATDILNYFEKKNLADLEIGTHNALLRIADLGGPGGLFSFREKLQEISGLGKFQMNSHVSKALVGSSTINYLHLGRPERIIINTDENVREFWAVEAAD